MTSERGDIQISRCDPIWGPTEEYVRKKIEHRRLANAGDMRISLLGGLTLAALASPVAYRPRAPRPAPPSPAQTRAAAKRKSRQRDQRRARKISRRKG